MPEKPRAAEFLHLHHRKQLVGPGAAVFLGHGHAQKAVVAGLVPHRAVHIALLFPVGMERGNFLVHETAKTVAKGFVVGGKKGSLDHGVTWLTKIRLFIQSNCFA